MSGALVVGEITNGRLGEATACLVAAAVDLGGPVTLGVVTNDSEPIAAQAAFVGIDQIVAVTADAEPFNHEVQAAAVAAMIDHQQPALVLMGYTIRAASFAAGLAESLDLGFASDAIDVRRDDAGALLAIRPLYGGKVQAEVAFSQDVPAMILMRPNAHAAAAAPTAPPVHQLAFDPAGISRVRHQEFRQPDTGVDLTQAEVILAVGRGVGEQEKIQPFAQIAELLGVALGASRPVVDSGWLPSAHQVGQTGVTVKPRLYVAFGISGALQHLAGMQTSNTIVAVNTDPDAAIFNVAHEGAVADIHEVAEHIKALLETT